MLGEPDNYGTPEECSEQGLLPAEGSATQDQGRGVSLAENSSMASHGHRRKLRLPSMGTKAVLLNPPASTAPMLPVSPSSSMGLVPVHPMPQALSQLTAFATSVSLTLTHLPCSQLTPTIPLVSAPASLLWPFHGAHNKHPRCHGSISQLSCRSRS